MPLFLAKRWRTPPTSRVDVDWNCDVAAAFGLECVWIGTQPSMIMKPGRIQAASTQSGTKAGSAIHFESGSSQYVETSYTPAGLARLSLGAIIKAASTDNFAVSSRSTSSTDGCEFLVGGAGVAGDVSFRIDGNSGSGNSPTVSGQNDGRFHHYIGYYNGADARIYADGFYYGFNSVVAGTINSAQTLQIGRRGSTYFTGDVALVYCGHNALSDGLVRAMMDNPWQIFRPISARVYSFPSAGAASTIPPLYHQRQQQGMAS